MKGSGTLTPLRNHAHANAPSSYSRELLIESSLELYFPETINNLSVLTFLQIKLVFHENNTKLFLDNINKDDIELTQQRLSFIPRLHDEASSTS